MCEFLRVTDAASGKAVFESEAFERDWCYDGDDLGAVYRPEGTMFKVWAPTAQAVTLNLYEDGGGGAAAQDPGAAGSEGKYAAAAQLPVREFAMKRGKKGVYELFVPGELHGIYYTYSVSVGGVVRETPDVYGRASGVNGRRSMVVDLRRTDPEGWACDGFVRAPGAANVIYELHVKDFSDDPMCCVRPEWRGKFLAFSQTGTRLAGHEDFATGIDYLKALGITHVHLLPAFDFGSVDEADGGPDAFNWGYDPAGYNVPEGSYATNAFDGAVRIREFKVMVKALHDAGLGVIMDVVYNHTQYMDGAFGRTVPGYYYRTDAQGHYSNGSCCGNDTASERQMFRKFMVDSVCYWAQEYHVDGFRFDLMGLHDIQTMNAIRKALDVLPGEREILMYGEPWCAGKTAMASGSVPAVKKNVHGLDRGIAIFNDDTRDTIKGSVFFEEEGGYVNGRPENASAIKSCVLAWCDGHGGYRPHDPGQVISYVSAHDNFTLWDKLVYTSGDGVYFDRDDERLLRMNRMAAGIVFTCMGHVFFQAGEEFARTKAGIGDSYNKPPEINRLDWRRAYEHRSLIDYYRGLITLRKSFGGFSHYDGSSIDRVTFVAQQMDCMVSFVMEGLADEAHWQRLFVIYNPLNRKQQAELPDGAVAGDTGWKMISNGTLVWDAGTDIPAGGYLWTEPVSVTILGVPAGH